MFDFNQFKVKLSDHLKGLGRKGNTAPPTSQDPGDKLLHQLYVDQQACSFFDKQRKATLDEVLKAFPKTQTIVSDIVEGVKKAGAGDKAVIFTAENYSLNLEVRKPAASFKKEKLEAELRKKGWSQEDYLKLVAKCTEDSEPAKVFSVLPAR